MLKALFRLIFFIVPEFFFSAAAAIIFDNYEIRSFYLSGSKLPLGNKELRVLQNYLKRCLQDSEEITKAGQNGEKETDG